ncbi:MAG: sugar ABC transporter permease [Chloroflexi bacterium]|nr:sugar ABC transporter permease [Chloroflexota bacterium]
MNHNNTQPKTSSDDTTHRRLSGKDRLVLEVLSIVTILIGVVVLLYFFNSVRTDSKINEVLDWSAEQTEEDPNAERPSLLLAFLDSFGIIVPILILFLGGLFIRLGWWLRQRNVNAARWAQITYAWLAIASGMLAILQPVIDGVNTDSLLAAVPFVLLVIPFRLVLLWLDRALDNDVFLGEEPFAARDTRTAWSLLVPTMAVLIIVAARPLEQSFINSLTDKRFASQTVPNFVGLGNYEKLMTVRFDVVECRRDDNGECRRRDDGSIRWELIDRSLLEDGYRTAWNLNWPIITDSEHALAVSGLDAEWLKSVWTTLQFVAASVSLELLIGLFIALTVNSNFRGRGYMRAVMLVPWAIPTVISARLWELMLKD